MANEEWRDVLGYEGFLSGKQFGKKKQCWRL